MTEIRYPAGWTDATDNQKEDWAAEGDGLLAKESVVPKNSLQSFAIAWRYERRVSESRRAKRSKSISRTAGEGSSSAKIAIG